MIKTGKELALAAKALAQNHKTLYVLGCFGWPMNDSNKNRAINAYAYNRKQEREEKIRGASCDTFGFDCVCMIKSLLWGWRGDCSKAYGGAIYCSNGVPDINANRMIETCNDVTTDFSRIQVGEVVWMKGHIGVYIGDGLAVECTPKWEDGVQITAVHNLGKKSGYNGRYWTTHGKLPYITYEREYGLRLRMLRQGDRGDAVKALQYLLMGRGFGCGNCGADGIFGGDTFRATTGFQSRNGLTVDGIAGLKTMGALLGVESIE